jgi:hypothetical protein
MDGGMRELFASGRGIDLVLLLMAIEAVVLWAYRRTTGSGVPPRMLFANLVAGGCLLLALRAGITDDGYEMVALWMAAALLAHLADLVSRWERR